MRHLLRALRHRNYRLFFGGQAASLLGMWLQMTAQAWLMFQLTHSAAAVGLLAFAQHGPTFFLGPIAGALADRHDRRRLLGLALGAAFFPALVLGILTTSHLVEPWHVFVLAGLLGLTRALEIPTRQALMPEIVEHGDLANAVALNSVLFNGARLVGPPLAGLLIAAVGEGWCFIANAATYIPILLALLAMRLRPRAALEHASASLLGQIRDGLRFVLEQRAMRTLMAVVAVLAFAGAPYGVLLPSLVRRVLGGDARHFGTLNGAIGLGAILGALLLARRRTATGLERWVLSAGVCFGLSLMALSQMRSLVPILLTLVLVGLGFMVQMAGTTTLLQLMVPDALRGRIMAFHAAIFLGFLPLGGVVAGTLADRLGEGPVILVGGALSALAVLTLGAKLWRREIDFEALTYPTRAGPSPVEAAPPAKR